MSTPYPADIREVLRHWRMPLALATLLSLLQALGLQGQLEYQRTAVLHGQVWRLLTGSLVHLGWPHLARDIAGFFLLWALFGRSASERTWLCVLAVSALAAGVGLLTFSPQTEWYVGISGALFGMFCAGALWETRTRPLYAGALLLGLVAVIAWTIHAGALPGEARGLGGKVIPQAHLYGALGGAAAGLLWGIFSAATPKHTS